MRSGPGSVGGGAAVRREGVDAVLRRFEKCLKGSETSMSNRAWLQCQNSTPLCVHVDSTVLHPGAGACRHSVHRRQLPSQPGCSARRGWGPAPTELVKLATKRHVYTSAWQLAICMLRSPPGHWDALCCQACRLALLGKST
jgi:hypothetical protein